MIIHIKGDTEQKRFDLFEATSFDNQHNLPLDTVQDWKTLQTSKPKMYKRFVLNSWEDEDVQDIIIPPEWVTNCVGRQIFSNPIELRRVISIDVARYGDDATTIYGIENNIYKGKRVYNKKSTMETVGLAILFANQVFQTDNFAVDEIGVGAGVADRLHELKKNVIFVNSAKKSSNKNCYNVRAEIYDYGARLFENGNVAISSGDAPLIEQLSWATYKEIRSSGKFQVQHKDEIKKTYKCSPDHADAFLNGLWALQFVPPLSEAPNSHFQNGWAHPRHRRSVNA